MEEKTQQLQIKATDESLKGVYANMVQISHGSEEFILDFMTTYPPQPQVVSRIIISPSHAKRMAKALTENIKRYEGQYGTINEGENPSKDGIGFKVA